MIFLTFILYVIGMILTFCIDKNSFEKHLGIIFLCISITMATLLIAENPIKESAIKDYLNNKVDVTYKGYQSDSVFIVTDTIINFK